jgi:DNA-binding HxlR family transcriptional regulator
MRHRDVSSQGCAVARSVGRVGEWWTALFLRDALAGKKRYREFELSLGITPNILFRRLEGLVAEATLIGIQMTRP